MVYRYEYDTVFVCFFIPGLSNENTSYSQVTEMPDKLRSGLSNENTSSQVTEMPEWLRLVNILLDGKTIVLELFLHTIMNIQHLSVRMEYAMHLDNTFHQNKDSVMQNKLPLVKHRWR